MSPHPWLRLPKRQPGPARPLWPTESCDTSGIRRASHAGNSWLSPWPRHRTTTARMLDRLEPFAAAHARVGAALGYLECGQFWPLWDFLDGRRYLAGVLHPKILKRRPVAALQISQSRPDPSPHPPANCPSSTDSKFAVNGRSHRFTWDSWRRRGGNYGGRLRWLGHGALLLFQQQIPSPDDHAGKEHVGRQTSHDHDRQRLLH